MTNSTRKVNLINTIAKFFKQTYLLKVSLLINRIIAYPINWPSDQYYVLIESKEIYINRNFKYEILRLWSLLSNTIKELEIEFQIPTKIRILANFSTLVDCQTN